MEMKEFDKYKKIFDKDYPYINKYELDDGSTFYVEPNYYTQLMYVKDHFKDKFDKILNQMELIVSRNKRIIFTGNFEAPVVNKDDYYYREIDDVMGEIGLSFDNKANPESDWKD